MDSAFEKILEYVKALEIIDTHEHLPYNEEVWLKKYREQGGDVFTEYLAHYFSCDLVSAGLPLTDLQKVITTDLPVMEKWALLEPYWDAARHTGYGRSLDLAVRGIYGIDGISRETIEEVNTAFLASLKPGHFQRVLKELSQIKISLLDSLEKNLDCDRKFFRSVFRMDIFIFPYLREHVQYIEDLTGIRITSFDAWCECCRKMLDIVLEKGVVALKCGLAYQRSLKFERTTRAKAEAEFNDFPQAIARDGIHTQMPLLGQHCQNYMMHYILELANQRQLVYQFHTGLQEGFGNHISWSDPTLMTNLFIEYPDVRFDLFHISYPFQQKLSVLAKNFANVSIDMCWAHIISPQASVSALVEYLDAVPFNKINAFGGDYLFVDGVYGHQQIARENVSKALAMKVNEGIFDVDRAREIAHCLFYGNPLRIFRLD
jgi:hypothetical protein